MIIRSNVKLLMKIRGKRIVDLVEEIGIDEFTIKKSRSSEFIESCRLESLYKIAKALSVDFEDLFEIIANGELSDVQK